MNYKLTKPCNECPFLIGSGFTFAQLLRYASGEFACHKACALKEGVFQARGDKTPHCAGALIFLEKRNQPHQMMRICERIGYYDRTKLDMHANVGTEPKDYRR